MTVSKQAKREAKELFRCCQVGALMDEGRARAAVRRVLETRPRGYLGILSHFQRLVKLEIERRTARIEGPMPLPPDLQASIQAGLARVYGPGLYVSVAQNPSLIGGLRIKVGSDVYDGSIKARLAGLEESFERNDG
ncbi:MAG: FoF1 ATP synthase subunit delta [Limisphaerales bacterium]